MVHCIDVMHGFITIHKLNKSFGAVDSDLRRIEMAYIQEVFVSYVKRTQAAFVFFKDTIGH
jgi:hypothetical protein